MLIQTEEAVHKYADAMSTANVIAIDTETTNNVETEERTSAASLWDGRNWLMGISVAFDFNGEMWSCYFPFRHETGNLPSMCVGPIKSVLESRTLTFHNRPFDIASLSTIGITPHGDFFDTIAMAHLCNEEFPSKELDWLAKYVLKDEGKDDEKLKKWVKIYGWNSIPPEIMAPYACKDAELHLRLFKTFYREMSPA